MNSKGFAHLLLVILVSVFAVGGLFYYSWQNGLIRTTPNIENAADTSASPNISPSDWNTYVDPKKRFSFKYPDHLDFKEHDNGIRLSFGDPTGDDWENSLWFTLTLEKTTLKEYLQNNPCEGKDVTQEWPRHLYESCINLFETDKKDYTIGGIKGFRSTLNPYENPLVINLFEHNGWIYDIRHTSDYHTQKGLYLANQILSTFEFLDDGDKTEEKTTTDARIISYAETDGWQEFSSSAGYSVQHPPYFIPSNSNEQFNYYGKNDCSMFFANNVGGVLLTQVVPYNGGSRRKLYDLREGEGYSYAFEEVVIQGKKSLIIERGPLGDSGSGSGVVIPSGNFALILSWSGRGKDSVEFVNLLKSVKLESKLDANNCGR